MLQILFLLYLIAVALLINLFLDVRDFNTPKFTLPRSLTHFLLYFIDLIIKLTITLCGSFGAPARLKRFMRYIIKSKKINLSEASYKSSAYTQNWKITTVAVLILITCISLIVSECYVNIFIANDVAEVTIYLHCLHVFENIIVLLLMLQIVSIAWIILRSLQEVNENIRVFIIEMKKNNHRASAKAWDPHKKFLLLTDSYLSVCDTVRQVNKNEGGMMLIVLLHAIFNLLITAFHGAVSIALPVNHFLHTPGAVQQFVWCLYNVSSIVFLIEPCHRTQDEVEQVKILMGRLVCTVDSIYDPFLMDLEEFYRQIMFQKPLYSPLNICTLGRPLVTTVIATITTGLVTIFQFYDV